MENSTPETGEPIIVESPARPSIAQVPRPTVVVLAPSPSPAPVREGTVVIVEGATQATTPDLGTPVPTRVVVKLVPTEPIVPPPAVTVTV
jgi:hypothetical protein